MQATETLVALPSGGRAWISRTVSHEQHNALRRHSLRISRFLGPSRDADGNAIQDWRTDLTEDQLDQKDALVLESPSLHIRTIALRWEDVTGVGGEPLTFPDDVDRMGQPDFNALFEAVTEAQSADPNAPSRSDSS